MDQESIPTHYLCAYINISKLGDRKVQAFFSVELSILQTQ